MAFLLLIMRYERTSVTIPTNLSFSAGETIFDHGRMTTVPLGRVPHHCQIPETGVDSCSFK